MLNYLIEKLKRYHIKGMTVHGRRTLAFQNLETAERCILFWIAEEVPLSVIHKVLAIFPEHLEMNMISFVQNPKHPVEHIEKALYIDATAITYSGKFNRADLQQLLEREEGLFLDLSLGENVYGDYIVKYARTACKIGSCRSGVEHDVALRHVRDTGTFVERLFGLLTKINTY